MSDVELFYVLYEVNDCVFVWLVDNFYYFGVVIVMNEEKVYVLFDDENIIICSVRDIFVVILDKVFDFVVLKRNSYVIVLC